jgi:hypothetical protein
MKGIENLKLAMAWAISTAAQTAKTFEDGKLRFLEILGFVDEGKMLAEIIPKIPEIAAEFKDLTTEEKNELVAYVEREFNIDNASAQFGVKITLDQLATTYISLEGWKAIIKGKIPTAEETDTKPVA